MVNHRSHKPESQIENRRNKETITVKSKDDTIQEKSKSTTQIFNNNNDKWYNRNKYKTRIKWKS